MNKATQIYNNEYKKKKIEIYERDGWKCVFNLDNGIQHGGLDVDHIRKRSLGGKNNKENLVTLCRLCHSVMEQIDNYTKEKILFDILSKRYGYKYN